MVWSSNGRSVRRTVDLYDERQPLADTKPGGLRVGGKSCGSRSRRERHSGGSSARSQSRASCKHLDDGRACDQSRRPRCWPLGRGAHPVRGCSASASGYLQGWRRRSTLPRLRCGTNALVSRRRLCRRSQTVAGRPFRQPRSRRPTRLPAWRWGSQRRGRRAQPGLPQCAEEQSRPRARLQCRKSSMVRCRACRAHSSRSSWYCLARRRVRARTPCPAFGRFHGSAMPKHARVQTEHRDRLAGARRRTVWSWSDAWRSIGQRSVKTRCSSTSTCSG